jgi:hypothetical protein
MEKRKEVVCVGTFKIWAARADAFNREMQLQESYLAEVKNIIASE